MLASLAADLTSRHLTDVHHLNCDSGLDLHLPIDLLNLPASCATITVSHDFMWYRNGGISLPLFIAGPVFVLYVQNLFAREHSICSFLNYLFSTEAQSPTPFHPDCDVCRLVEWLITECSDLIECYDRLFCQSQSIVFEIIKEIWSRLQPKPFRISKQLLNLCKCMELKNLSRNDWFSLPGNMNEVHQGLDWSNKRSYSLFWMNAIMRATHAPLNKRCMLENVTCFYLSHMIRIFQRYVRNVSPSMCDSGDIVQFQILNAIKSNPVPVRNALKKLAMEIAFNLAEVEESTKEELGCNDSDTLNLMKVQVVENILVINTLELFSYDATIDSLYVHCIDCSTDPSRCFCSYAKSMDC